MSVTDTAHRNNRGVDRVWALGIHAQVLMFGGIETASRACKTIIIKRSKVRTVNHTFLPEGIQIEDLTQAFCHA